ncbi:MAG: bifunctional prephenate dehydrogenase/3-phosphoshikimate 1-carboxyvinyltransferase [Gammaproteobacteria bacterium]|nr:bifunctional prephenate dehydrogenase/3-phosphoshikimate 1-carboxyvinyltransferase [Gammaproteobacteria bacterium]
MSAAELNGRLSKVVIIGLGLIGGSFARGLKQGALCDQVVGCARSTSTLEKGLALGVIDAVETDLTKAVQGADLVFLSMPIGATENILSVIAPHLEEHTIVTDAGSVKGCVVEAAERVFGEIPINFIPGHPIAGSEKSGVAAGTADLFLQHKVILTPVENHSSHALLTVRGLWEAMGAEVVLMDHLIHDKVLAATSHLPHLLAYSLVDTLAKDDENLDIFRYAAGGFRDFTRIAASDPTMWHDIFLANRAATLEMLDGFTEGLSQLREAVDTGNSQKMLGVFTRAQAAREHFSTISNQRAYLEPMSESMNQQKTAFILKPGKQVRGKLRVPGDKSISHRSIILGSIADGETHVEGFLEGEDALATLQAFRDLGVVIEGPHQGRVKIYGVGLNGLTAPPGDLYLGNSGTSMRLLAGLLSAQSFPVTLTGDESLSKRPMGRVANPLREMGVEIDTAEDGSSPLKIMGAQNLSGISYKMPMASAQVKSCLLLAGLYADSTTVIEPAVTRDHTERMLRGFGVSITQQGDTVTLKGGQTLKACSIDIPADISSAAFFMVAASIAADSEILLEHVGVNPTRTGIIDILRLMGADISLQNTRDVGGEPVADVLVRSANLKGIDVPEHLVPLAIDEFPVLFVAAACADGTTRLTGAEELRVKESDRIQVMADGLVALGIDANATPDGIVIQGKGNKEPQAFTGGIIDSHGDHRIAMAFSVASLRSGGEICIENCANVATSFPSFVQQAQKAGIQVSVKDV